MSFSNYGIRLYSLNEQNLYSFDLMEKHLSGIKRIQIHEISKNEFIFCSEEHHEDYSFGCRDYDEIIID